MFEICWNIFIESCYADKIYEMQKLYKSAVQFLCFTDWFSIIRFLEIKQRSGSLDIMPTEDWLIIVVMSSLLCPLSLFVITLLISHSLTESVKSEVRYFKIR